MAVLVAGVENDADVVADMYKNHGIGWQWCANQ
jgi:hypothetical protein